MPEGAGLVAGNFKIGAELGVALGEADIPVLDPPFNRAHGRAPQLQLSGLHREQRLQPQTMLDHGASYGEYNNLQKRYPALCARRRPLPGPAGIKTRAWRDG